MEFNSPTARIIWGHPRKGQPVKDDQTKAVKMKQDGVTPRVAWSVGLAIPKDQCAALFDVMQKAALEEFPAGAPQTFAWKFKDGDTGLDDDGNPLSRKEGYAGCYVFACSTEFQAPQNYEFDHGTQKWVESDKIKRGDYVVATLDIKGHKAINRGKPGLYINPKTLCLWQVGAEIKGGDADPNSRFAAPPQQTPSAPIPGALPGPAGTQSAAPAPSAPVPGASNGPRPDNATPPRHDQFLQGPTPPGGAPAPRPPGSDIPF